MDIETLPRDSVEMELSYPVRTKRTHDLPPKPPPELKEAAEQSHVSEQEDVAAKHVQDEDSKLKDITAVLFSSSSSSAKSPEPSPPSSQASNYDEELSERLSKTTDATQSSLQRRSLLARLSDSSTYANPDISMPFDIEIVNDFDKNHPMLAGVDELESSEVEVTMREYQIWGEYKWMQKRGWWSWTPTPLRSCLTAVRNYKDEKTVQGLELSFRFV